MKKSNVHRNSKNPKPTGLKLVQKGNAIEKKCFVESQKKIPNLFFVVLRMIPTICKNVHQKISDLGVGKTKKLRFSEFKVLDGGKK